MKKGWFIFLLLLVSFLSLGQTGRGGFYTNRTTGGGGVDYVWGALAWYEFTNNYNDTYDSNDATPGGNSYVSSNYLDFYESDRNDYINIGDFIPVDCDTITVFYEIQFITDDNTTYKECGNTNGGAGNPGWYLAWDGTGTGYFNPIMRGIDNDGTDSYATTVSGGNCVTNITDDEWHKVAWVLRRNNAASFHWLLFVDGTECFASAGDSIISKGGWELFGNDIYFGNSMPGGTGGVADTQYDNLILVRGDARYNPDGNLIDLYMTDPETMLIK